MQMLIYNDVATFVTYELSIMIEKVYHGQAMLTSTAKCPKMDILLQ